MRITIFRSDDDRFGYIEGWDIGEVDMQGIAGYKRVDISTLRDEVSKDVEDILKLYYEGNYE